MGESSIVRDHDMRESSMVRDHDMVESSMVRDDNVKNQIVVLPEDLQQPEQPGMVLLIVPCSKVQNIRMFPVNYVPIMMCTTTTFPTPNGTPYWVPDVPEDEKPKEGLLFDSYNDAYETYLVYSQKARFNIRKGGFKRKTVKHHAVFQSTEQLKHEGQKK
ncbi:hypothetical protein Tco_0084851 [Tanacetum coccineum]